MRSTRAVARLVWVAVLTIGGWGAARPAMAAGTPEPPAPSATRDAQAALDEAGRLREAGDCEAALEAAYRALRIARGLADDVGAALAHRSRALCLAGTGRPGDAVDAWKRAATSWQLAGHGPGRVEALAQASPLCCRDCSRESDALVDEALEIAGREIERPLAAAEALHDAGNSAARAGRQDIAHRLFSGAVEMRRRNAPGSLVLAQSLIGQGRSAMDGGGDEEEARAALDRALEIAEAVEPDGPTVAVALFHTARLAAARNDFEAAVRHGREAVRIRERLSPGTAELAACLVALAEAEIMLGDLEIARLHELAALEIGERLHPGGRELVGPLTGLGIAALRNNDLEAARRYFDRAVELMKAHGDDPVDLACSLLNVGVVTLERQDEAAARRLFTQVVALLDEHAPDHPIRAKALTNLAETAFRLGDDRAGAEYARQALPLLESSMPGSISYSIALSRLGQAASSMGDSRAALDYHRRALAIRERLQPDSEFVAESLFFLMTELIGRGDLERAERYGRQALGIVGSGTASRTAAQVATRLALIERDKGDHAEAEELLEYAVSSWTDYGGPDHGSLATAYTHLAGLYVLQDLPHQAFGAALRAEAIDRGQVRRTARSLPERDALRYGWSTCDGVLSLAVAYLDRVPEAPGLALDAVVRSRAIVLDEVAARNRLAATADDPEISRLARDLDAARERLAGLAVRGVSADDAGAYRTDLAAAVAERKRAEDELAFRSREFQAEQAARSAGLEQVVSRLPAGWALVAYVRYNRFSTDAITTDWGTPSGPATPSYVAFLARPDNPEVVMAPLGDAADIDRLVDQLRNQIAAFAAEPERSPGSAERAYRAVGDGLRVRIWDPIAPHLGGVERVIVVPDGSLNLVNLSALPVGEDRYLVDTGPRLHHVSAERDLLRWDGAPAGRGLLVLGGPDFDDPTRFAALRPSGVEPPITTVALVPSHATFRGGRSTCARFGSLRFRPLPSSGREVDDIVAVWERAAGPAARSADGSRRQRDLVVLTGPGADESSFKGLATGRQVLHLATHGFFLGRPCPSGPDPAIPGSRGTDPPPNEENTLLLAGLALAGANHRGSAGADEDDGVLTAEEIAGLDLDGVGWAVLSACNTGVGEVAAGEGVFGLRRAFQVAGVRTLITSLWKVEDEASRDWMRQLYENRLVEGLSTIDSVHGATLAVLEARRSAGLGAHPFYWAGFIASGDWR